MIRSSFFALCLSACTAAAPIAAVAQAPTQAVCSGLTWKQVMKLADDNDWSTHALNEAQLAKAIARYNEAAKEYGQPQISRKDVDGGMVAEHDGFPAARFLFFKAGCPVGQMLTLPIGTAQAIMGHDA